MGQKILKRYKSVGLDSNIFSYHFYQDPEFGYKAKEIFNLLSKNQLKATTSIITLIELLSIKAPLAKIKGLLELFLDIPNLTVVDIRKDVALEAAKIRRRYGLRTPDAIQLATTVLTKTKMFITNDRRLKSFREIKVVMLKEVN